MSLRGLILFGLLGFATSVFAEWSKGVEAFKKKDFAAAAEEFEEVTRTNRKYAGAYYMLGLAQSGLGQSSQALANLRRAVELEGGNASYRIALGQALVKADQFQEAYSTLQPLDLTAIDGQYRSAYALIFAQAATKTNRFDEAIRVLSAQAQSDAKNARLHQALGVVYDAQGDDRKAFASFKRSFELDPTDDGTGRSTVTSGIAAALRSANEADKVATYTDAARVAERLVAMEDSIEHIILAGEAWLGAKQYHNALKYFELAGARQSPNALTLHYEAVCYVGLSENDKALQKAQAALDAGAEGKLAENSRALIARLTEDTEQVPEGTVLPECPGFRDTRWGESKGKVIAAEGQPVVNEGASVAFKGEVAGKEVLISYHFVEDQLVSGRYILVEEYTFKNQYIDVFDEFKDLLAKKYGKPVLDVIHWENELFRDEPGEWGQAVSVGHVTFRAKWITDQTDIVLLLGGSNFKSFLAIDYSSRALKDLAREADTKAKLDGL